MFISLSELDDARSLITNCENGHIITGHLPHLRAAINTRLHLNNEQSAKLIALHNQMGAVEWEIQNFFVGPAKMEWLHSKVAESELTDETWLYFGAAEANAFHVVMKSALDQFCSLVVLAYDLNVGAIYGFGHLFRDCRNSSNRIENLDAQLVSRLASLDWFTEFNDARNDIVHNGTLTLAFPNQDEILVGFSKGLKAFHPSPEVMHNENILDFRLYGALVCSHLILLIDELSKIVAEHIDYGEPNDLILQLSQRSYGGLGTVVNWIDRLRTRLDGNQRSLATAATD